MNHLPDCLFDCSQYPNQFEAQLHQQPQSRKFIIYDCETAKCIPNGDRSPNLQYCKGWDDFEGMGIAVICAYSSWDDCNHVYLQDNLVNFQALVDQAQEIVGFNSLSFDDKLCAAKGLQVKTTYDLLCHIRVAAGMPPHYVKGVTRSGYSLEQLAKVNLDYSKSQTGAIAPELWQKGNYGAVIDYCLTDVNLTRKLYEGRAKLIDPTNQRLLTLT
ncbi:hypothetical protein [Iningainema tapete]|uniref:Uncharacterized protein n=1 Tax=Iningainema tapete BLCC-T55 TaxID=2748662 RepID=A0A8J6XAN9_9CYAN|nr:hypothetical protein [Iningainema tapete]MBD2771395.1 hypothetical protein [Iningainema tapete BLCC-T55]